MLRQRHLASARAARGGIRSEEQQPGERRIGRKSDDRELWAAQPFTAADAAYAIERP
jgi:hypothetical protein